MVKRCPRSRKNARLHDLHRDRPERANSKPRYLDQSAFQVSHMRSHYSSYSSKETTTTIKHIPES